MLVAMILGCGRVQMKFQDSRALPTAVLPGFPLEAFSAIRSWCGNASSTSSCQASGVTPGKTSRTKTRGSFFQV